MKVEEIALRQEIRQMLNEQELIKTLYAIWRKKLCGKKLRNR